MPGPRFQGPRQLGPHVSDTHSHAGSQQGRVDSIKGIDSAMVLFVQLRPFIPLILELPLQLRDFLEPIGLVTCSVREFWVKWLW